MGKKSQVLEQIALTRGYLFLILSLVFLLSPFVPWSSQTLLVWLTIISILYSFPFMGKFPMFMTLIMLGIGHVIFFKHAVDLNYWELALIKNLPLVALFVSVPLFTYPLRNGGYVQYISRLSQRLIKSPLKLHFNIVLGTMTLASFINHGAVRIIFELFDGYIRENNKFYIKSLSQGFSLAICWSPYFAGVAIVLNILSLPIFPFLLWGFLLVFVGSLLSTVLIYKEAKKINMFPDVDQAAKEMAMTIDEGSHHQSLNKGFEMILVFIGMFVAIFILDLFLDVNLVILISIVAFIYPVIWSFFIRKTKAFVVSLKDYKENILPRLHNEAILFISAAFFAEMIKLTSFSETLMGFYLIVSDFNPILVIFITIVMIVVPAVLGIHQILMISVLGASIAVSSLPISVEAFGLSMIVGWSLSTLISPVTGLNLTLGNLLNKNPYIIGFWNLKYVLFVIPIFSVIIYFISLLTESIS